MPTAGFTLIEIMVVLLILGLLAGITVPTFMGRADKARLQKVEADLATLATALSLYRLDNDMLPTTEQGLQALVNRPALSPRPSHWKAGGYMESLPRDPWERPYLYLSPARGGEGAYDLYTLGADGAPGGEGQNADIYR